MPRKYSHTNDAVPHLKFHFGMDMRADYTDHPTTDKYWCSLKTDWQSWSVENAWAIVFTVVFRITILHQVNGMVIVDYQIEVRGSSKYTFLWARKLLTEVQTYPLDFICSEPRLLNFQLAIQQRIRIRLNFTYLDLPEVFALSCRYLLRSGISRCSYLLPADVDDRDPDGVVNTTERSVLHVELDT